MVDGQLKKFCEICSECGKTSRLRLYQINFDEAYYMCENVECSYPLDVDDSNSTSIINRDFRTITTPSQRRQAAAANQTTPFSTSSHFPNRPPSVQSSLRSRVSFNSVKSSTNFQNIPTAYHLSCAKTLSKSSPVQLNPNIVSKFQPINLKSIHKPSVTGDTSHSRTVIPVSTSKSTNNHNRRNSQTTQSTDNYLEQFAGFVKSRVATPPSVIKPKTNIERNNSLGSKENSPSPTILSCNVTSLKRKSRSVTPELSKQKKQKIENLFSKEVLSKSSLSVKSQSVASVHRQSPTPREIIVCRPAGSLKGEPRETKPVPKKVTPADIIQHVLKKAKTEDHSLGASKFAPFQLKSPAVQVSKSVTNKISAKYTDVFKSLTCSAITISKDGPNLLLNNNVANSDKEKKAAKPKVVFSTPQTIPKNKKTPQIVPTTKSNIVRKSPLLKTQKSQDYSSCVDDYCDSFDTSLFDDVAFDSKAAEVKSEEEIVYTKLLNTVNDSTLKLKQSFPEYKNSSTVNNFRKEWDQSSDGRSVTSSASSSPKLSPFELKTNCESAVNIDSLLLDCRDHELDQEVSYILSSQHPAQDDGCAKINVKNPECTKNPDGVTDIIIFADSINKFDNAEVDFEILDNQS
ncbi:uncharacterized protein LOC126829706 isoform X2 [Patella vulgata]|uniref:uncharacterized protein LOC126829706 isoform X2 n=1 Tax=Patella vulgata TaxID=6465 RepID=UPI0024A82BF2|nr:uncharacterized protein LOC126829706 isoform X2 [Patella vulgata]